MPFFNIFQLKRGWEALKSLMHYHYPNEDDHRSANSGRKCASTYSNMGVYLYCSVYIYSNQTVIKLEQVTF